MKKELYILSYGLKFSHITLETLDILKKCGAIYCPVFDSITGARFIKVFPELGPKLKLFAWRDQKQMDSTVLSGFKEHGTVCVLTFGNPAFLNGYFHNLAVAAQRKKIRTIFLNAVSSIDALITLFGLNLQNGLRIIDVGEFAGNTALTPGINTMFFSVNRFNSAARSIKPLFLSRIAGVYRADAAVYLAACRTEFGGDSVLKGTVGALPSLLGKAEASHTLFIPADSWVSEGRNNFYGQRENWRELNK